jgi:hypothetical protein
MLRILALTKILFLLSVLRLIITANVGPNPPSFVTLTMEEIRSSETSVLTKATLCNIPEDGILHSRRHENLESCWTIVISMHQGDKNK